MRRVAPLLVVMAAGVLAMAWPAAALPPAAQAVPKTVILGFDGMDYALSKRWMDEGKLPNLKRLADQGLFQPLQTSNPAQSPVSWAVFNTGCNPGKTGVAGFISRFFTPTTKDRNGNEVKGRPMPQQMLGFPEKVPADDFVPFPIALHQPGLFVALAALCGAVVGFLLGLLLHLALRVPLIVGLVLALLAAGGAGWYASRWAASLPADGKLPYIVNPMQGTNFWTYLDRAGIRTRGVQVASTYPPDDEGPETHLLSGLGVMDVTGAPGSWYVYTTDKWRLDKRTATSGRIIHLFEEEPNRLASSLYGPRNWVQEAELQAPIDALQKERDALKPDDPGLKALDDKLAAARDAKAQWSNGGDERTRSLAPFTMDLDKAAHAVTFHVAGRSFRVEQGGWSEMTPVEFPLNDRYKARGLVTFHVLHCADDDDGLRVFVPPINIDPLDPPPQMPISAPPAFAAELQHEIGHPYETLGWACITNPLKDAEDSKLPEQSFMDDMESTEKLREDLLVAGLDRPGEWDVYFQVFSTTDRVGHMVYREFDPGHPAHDAAEAATTVHAFGRTFPLSDAIQQVYMNADRIVGRVLEKLDSGALGPDCLLMVVSDHGFSSFRRQVNLCNVLHDLGYLVFKDDAQGKPLDLDTILESSNLRDFLMYVDWSRTRAYSMGLGEVYINLRGREPQGIVAPEEYDALVEKIRADLLALKDPKDGASVVTSVSRRDKLYSGPWWKEGTAQRKVYRKMVEVKHDGFADLFLGYAPNYRVSWANSLGSLDSAAITDNDNRWSGDHVSVDPAHVPGVLFSNRKLSQPAESGLMDIGPTMLLRYGLDPSPPHTEMDGHGLPFENLTR
jgi:predicted AlkP superfamily phosphohydrolase/phosphomutase